MVESLSGERKLEVVEIHIALALGLPDAHIWVTIPGGLLRGRPIKFEEYINLLMPSKKTLPETEGPKPERFFHLKDAQLVQGETVHNMRLAILDGLEVSACGVYYPASSVLP